MNCFSVISPLLLAASFVAPTLIFANDPFDGGFRSIPAYLQPVVRYKTFSEYELKAHDFRVQFESRLADFRILDKSKQNELRHFKGFSWILKANVGGDSEIGDIRNTILEFARKQEEEAALGVVLRTLQENIDNVFSGDELRNGAQQILLDKIRNKPEWNRGQNFITKILGSIFLDNVSRSEIEKLIQSRNLFTTEQFEDVTKKVDKLLKINNSLGNIPALNLDDETPLLSQFQLKIIRGAEFANSTASRIGSAANIVADLGDPNIAKTISDGAQVFTVASMVLGAFSGNPVAILPVMKSLATRFSDSKKPDPVTLQMQNIMQELEQITENIQLNNENLIDEISYLKFLNEAQFEGIGALIEGNIETCAALIPVSWKSVGAVENSDYADFVNLYSSLAYTDYESLLDSWNRGGENWRSCVSELGRFFNSSSPIYSAFTARFANNELSDPELLRESIDKFEKLKSLFPPDAKRKLLLREPAVNATDYASQFHLVRAEAIQELIPPLFRIDPTASELLDPYVVERYTGYLLGVLPFYGATRDDSTLVRFNELITHSQNNFRGFERLQKALSIVNLAIAQQLILSGEGFQGSESFAENASLLSEEELASRNIGLMLVADTFGKSSDRIQYIAAARSNNLDSLTQTVQSIPDIGLNSSVRIRPVNDKNNLQKLELVLEDNTTIFPLPGASFFDSSGLSFDNVVLEYSPHIARLLLLQDRIIFSLSGYEIGTTKGHLAAFATLGFATK